MRLPALLDGEFVRLDYTAPASVMVFPLLEFLAITGVVWMAIGFVDNPTTMSFDPAVRAALVALWTGLGTWRFALPLLRARRQRIILTNRRLILRPPRFGARADIIPLAQIHSVRKHRSGLSIAVYGLDRPLFVPDVPRAKRTAQLIESRV
ncbi:hypothetical protein [Corynebacterium uterequi]|uniref:DUF304 domain-containing protein n=1 Tax=Corynebacterium uterequi TaxID=1072256 RepID=A0A0G3HH57_9CORY|nr:hypothetical protein [Corynebacterium uterequi]AKK10507.1 hypothetical protein CUTER_02460 [Corynebacterium uterequi]